MAQATGSRRRFGRLRKLPSGRYQAGYVGVDGQVRTAEQTFATKGAAERWLTLTESELLRGTWSAPERREETVADWADRWMASRTGLAVRTVELYRWLLDRHVLPVLGVVGLGDLSPEDLVCRDRFGAPDHCSEGLPPTVLADASCCWRWHSHPLPLSATRGWSRDCSVSTHRNYR